VNAPKLLWLASIVQTCTGCKRWECRRPTYLGDELGKGYSCERCGVTSTDVREGKPYGPKSRIWAKLLKEWKEYWDWNGLDELVGLVKTEPPIEKLIEDADGLTVRGKDEKA
jgi:hypothetical protein